MHKNNKFVILLLCLAIVVSVSFLSNNFIWVYKNKYIDTQSYKTILSNYENLYNRLKSQEFDEASLATVNIVRLLTNTGKYEAVSTENLSCNHLVNLNKYWSEYSENKYGFSTQRKIWNDKGNVSDFVKKLSWENSCEFSSNNKSTSSSEVPKGHFPKCIFINTETQIKSFMNRLEQCSI